MALSIKLNITGTAGGRYTNVWHCEVLSMVPLQLYNPFGLFTMRRKFLPVPQYLSYRNMILGTFDFSSLFCRYAAKL